MTRTTVDLKDTVSSIKDVFVKMGMVWVDGRSSTVVQTCSGILTRTMFTEERAITSSIFQLSCRRSTGMTEVVFFLVPGGKMLKMSAVPNITTGFPSTTIHFKEENVTLAAQVPQLEMSPCSGMNAHCLVTDALTLLTGTITPAIVVSQVLHLSLTLSKTPGLLFQTLPSKFFLDFFLDFWDKLIIQFGPSSAANIVMY